MVYLRNPSRGYYPLYEWVDCGNGYLPSDNSVIGGYDLSGEKIYVGRASHNADVIPGKIVPSHSVCYVPYAGKENSHHSYQVLVVSPGCELIWVPASEGNVPTGAIQGGTTDGGEKLFIGRVHHEGTFCVGKIHPSHHCCYYPFGGNELNHRQYEVLCIKYLPNY